MRVAWLAALLLAAWARAEGGRKIAADEWEMTSGELRRYESDLAGAPALGSDSAVFRMRSAEASFGDVEVSVDVLNRGLAKRGEAWDGIHVWLRYQSPTWLYAVSVNRRDNRVVIKKKVTGGPSYGGTYYNLAPTAPYEVPYGRWQHIVASALDNPDGSVTLRLAIDGKPLLEAIDDGSSGGPPIARTGRVGLRADDADFRFRDFTVRGAPPPSPAGRGR